MDKEIENQILIAFESVADGLKRLDLELGDGSTIKAYRVGNLIRIDVNVVEEIPF